MSHEDDLDGVSVLVYVVNVSMEPNYSDAVARERPLALEPTVSKRLLRQLIEERAYCLRREARAVVP